MVSVIVVVINANWLGRCHLCQVGWNDLACLLHFAYCFSLASLTLPVSLSYILTYFVTEASSVEDIDVVH